MPNSRLPMTRIVLLALAQFVLSACGDTAASACQKQCDKRAACGGAIDVAQCKRACMGSRFPSESAPCVEANLALQSCQVELLCDAYLAGTGCEAELRASTDGCR